MTEKRYLIGELSEAAGVSVRTIRYYLDEGLLPPPAVEGKYSTFDESYLERLEFIRRLKDAFLPLKEIRQQMLALSPEEIHRLLTENQFTERQDDGNAMEDRNDLRTISPASVPEKKRVEKKVQESLNEAEEYISRLLQPRRALPISPAPQPRPPQPAPRSAAWQRIELAPGLELHLRQQDQDRYRGLIQQLISLVENYLRKSV